MKTRIYHWYWNKVIVETPHSENIQYPHGMLHREWSEYYEISLLPLWFFLIVSTVCIASILGVI